MVHETRGSFYEKKLFILYSHRVICYGAFFLSFSNGSVISEKNKLGSTKSIIVSENKIEIYYVIRSYSCLNCEFQSCSWRGVRYTILCFLSGQIQMNGNRKRLLNCPPQERQATHLIRPVFHCRRGGFIRGGPSYSSFLFQ